MPLKNEPIMVYGDGTQQRCFCNVNNVVQAIYALSTSSEEVSILQLAERVKARAGSASEIKCIPYEEAHETGFEDFRRRVPSLDKIARLANWQPTTTLDETIDQILEYQRKEISAAEVSG